MHTELDMKRGSSLHEKVKQYADEHGLRLRCAYSELIEHGLASASAPTFPALTLSEDVSFTEMNFAATVENASGKKVHTSANVAKQYKYMSASSWTYRVADTRTAWARMGRQFFASGDASQSATISVNGTVNYSSTGAYHCASATADARLVVQDLTMKTVYSQSTDFLHENIARVNQHANNYHQNIPVKGQITVELLPTHNYRVYLEVRGVSKLTAKAAENSSSASVYVTVAPLEKISINFN